VNAQASADVIAHRAKAGVGSLAERDQQRLDQAARNADGTSTPGARSGSGSASVIEHLRELTRHRVSSDVSEPGPAPVVATGKRAERTPRRK